MKMTIKHKSETVFWFSATTVLVLGVLTAGAVAAGREPLRGPHPWDFPERNRDTAFAYQYARDNRGGGNGANGAAAIAGALGGTVIINNSTTAVGNWQQIEMTLGDGAEGLVMTENHQDNSGDSTAGTSILDNAFDVAGRNDSSSSHGNAGQGRSGSGGGSGHGHASHGKSGSHSSSGHGNADAGKSGSDSESGHGDTNDGRSGSRGRGGKDAHGSRDHQSHSGGNSGRHDKHAGGHKTSSGYGGKDREASLQVPQEHFNPCGRNGALCWGAVNPSHGN
ncbi:MAG: hypothetical protein P1V13_14325 [Rhizobiaceae bacterium]|nr:hypothetical protein [Rhizobiaceae bacterium]